MRLPFPGLLNWFIRDEAASLLLKTWGEGEERPAALQLPSVQKLSWLEGVRMYWDMSSGLIAWHICMIEDLQ